MTLRRSTKILLAGLGLSLFVLAAGSLNTSRLERQERTLQAECEAGNRVKADGPNASGTFTITVPGGKKYALKGPDGATKEQALAELRRQLSAGAGDSKPPSGFSLSADAFLDAPLPAWALAPLVCDAGSLVSDGTKLPGIQAKIVDAHRASSASRTWPLPAALVLFCLMALPWAWYALLRRIGELRAAIGGQPPEA
jgi:hypothetical protein